MTAVAGIGALLKIAVILADRTVDQGLAARGPRCRWLRDLVAGLMARFWAADAVTAVQPTVQIANNLGQTRKAGGALRCSHDCSLSV